MENLPNPPTGDSAQFSWMKKFYAFAMSSRIVSGPGYRIKRTPNGTSLEITATGGGAAPAPEPPRWG